MSVGKIFCQQIERKIKRFNETDNWLLNEELNFKAVIKDTWLYVGK